MKYLNCIKFGSLDRWKMLQMYMHMMKTGVGIAKHLKSLTVLWVANSWRKHTHTQLYNKSKVQMFDTMFTCQNNHCTFRAWNSDQLKTVDPGKIPISCTSKVVLCISDVFIWMLHCSCDYPNFRTPQRECWCVQTSPFLTCSFLYLLLLCPQQLTWVDMFK